MILVSGWTSSACIIPCRCIRAVEAKMILAHKMRLFGFLFITINTRVFYRLHFVMVYRCPIHRQTPTISGLGQLCLFYNRGPPSNDKGGAAESVQMFVFTGWKKRDQ